MDDDLRQKVVDFPQGSHGIRDAQVYDFMDSVGEAAFYGKASSLVMTLCDAQRFYAPPPGSRFEKKTS